MNPRTRATMMWVAISLAALLMGTMGMFKLIHHPMAVDAATRLHYGVGAMMVIGVFEVLGALALFLRPLRALASLGLLSMLIGAVGTHVGGGDGLALILIPVPAIALLGAVFMLDDTVKITYRPWPSTRNPIPTKQR